MSDSLDLTLPYHWSPRPYQQPLWSYLHHGGKRAVMCAHRRWGKDEVCLHHTACAAHERIGNYAHMLPEYAQARKAIWSAVNPHTGHRRIDEAFPDVLRESINDQEMVIRFKNGSTWQVVGSDTYNSLMGTSFAGIVMSEYALANPSAWAYFSPILRENDGWALFISTPRGHNHFESILKAAQAEASWFSAISTVDETQCFTTDELQEELRIMQETHGPDYGKAIWLQEYYCFPAGTTIHTTKGLVPIEEVKLFDVVLTHTGRWRSVLKIFTREVSEPMVDITVNGLPNPLSCTIEHPVRLLNRTTQVYSWVKAGDVRVGDYLVMPRLKTGKRIIGQELLTLIAWFITEGSVFRNASQFSLHRKETATATALEKAAHHFNLRTLIRQTDVNSQNVTVYGTHLADFLTTHCGSGAANKRIPWALVAGWENELLEMLLDGDGCRGDYGGAWAVYTTISRTLAQDVQLLASTLGYGAGVNARPAGVTTIHGRECKTSQSYAVRLSPRRRDDRKERRIVTAKNGVGVRVRSVARRDFSGPVFNLHVQYDNSYIANGLTVHNCSFDAAIPGSIWGDCIDRLKLQGRIADFTHNALIPVDTGWDLGRTDDTAIWFRQMNGHQIDIIDFHVSNGKDIDWYVDFLRERAKELGITYGTHWLPHDARPRTLAAGGKSILQQFMDAAKKYPDLGRFAIAPRLDRQEGIQAGRKTFAYCRFHKTRCAKGLELLRAYHRVWDDEKKIFLDVPEHDASSHPADAWRTLAMSWKFAKVSVPDSPLFDKLLAASVEHQTFGALKRQHFDRKRQRREANT